ncbi:translation initiation factor 3 subunit F [Fistulifera solaris]|uniref:Eukaryotic translation initiation factor 3 subunit F n=1 Tax=Fistulifera solaris TaxID=1519565 RepID=A0A1Z5JN12_FISSO|nr:translation initiation factor 3 subunit F [Fistulifera solaris]|eukprot:GAX15400.1 translation initiation factor 3 subunit F [Fistulifera solaris]
MPQQSPALLLDTTTTTTTTTTVFVHPLVLLHILDHHRRRPAGSARVIGTLLGRFDDSGVLVEVTNAFAVPHAERGDEVAIGKDFNKTMWALLQQNNNSSNNSTKQREVIVGWYSSSPLLSDTSSLIHDFYSTETEDGNPVHLVVDCRLTEENAVTMRAFHSTPIVVQGETLGNLFHELPLSLRSNEPEAICVSEMIKSMNKNADNNNNNETTEQHQREEKPPLQISMEQLYELLETISNYVDAVVEGTTPPDTEKGRHIADALATVPRMRPDAMDKLFHESLQDLLMVTYLSNLTQTQIAIAEKLNATLDLQ